MTDDLQARFEAAAKEARRLSNPGNDALLQLYALYKQATSGDVSGKRPGFTDMVGRAKYDAWAKMKGQSKEGAMEAYIKLAEKLNKQ